MKNRKGIIILLSRPIISVFGRSRTMKKEIKDLYDLWLKKQKVAPSCTTSSPP